MSWLFNRWTRVRRTTDDFFARWPWLTWAPWLIFCVNSLARNHPRRFGSTFEVYLKTARLFWTGRPVYELNDIGGYLYWPAFLVMLRPVVWLDDTTAAGIAMMLSAMLLSWATFVLVKAVIPSRGAGEVTALTGLVLLCNIPSAWFNFKNVQAQTGMTALMMFAAVAIMRSQWKRAALWLFFSLVIKPLSLVMLLLCGAVQRRMRLACACALLAVLALPFAVAESAYVIAQYELWTQKMLSLTAATPADWEMQADFASMLAGIGVLFPPLVASAVRFAAAFGTLALAWRIGTTQSPRVFGFAVLMLSGCFITLFGPRNETISFLVLSPALTVFAFLLLLRNDADRRGWLLIAAVLVLGFEVPFVIGGVIKPFVVCLIYGWFVWLTLVPDRWGDLIGADGAAARPGAGSASAV